MARLHDHGHVAIYKIAGKLIDHLERGLWGSIAMEFIARQSLSRKLDIELANDGVQNPGRSADTASMANAAAKSFTLLLDCNGGLIRNRIILLI